MTKLKRALPVLLLVNLLFSCSKDESIGAGDAAMDIADAKNLVLIDGNASGLTGGRLKATQDQQFNALYKIDASGNLQEVHYSHGEGSIDVDKIINLNIDYLVMLGKFVINDKNYFSLLVRKSDGVVFDFTDYDLNMANWKLGERFVKADGDGNLYYPMYNQIRKLDITDPRNITRTDYLPSGQTVWFSDIDNKDACNRLDAYRKQVDLCQQAFREIYLTLENCPVGQASPAISAWAALLGTAADMTEVRRASSAKPPPLIAPKFIFLSSEWLRVNALGKSDLDPDAAAEHYAYNVGGYLKMLGYLYGWFDNGLLRIPIESPVTGDLLEDRSALYLAEAK